MNDHQVRAGVCLFCLGQISVSGVHVCRVEAACDRAEPLASVSALKEEKRTKTNLDIHGGKTD